MFKPLVKHTWKRSLGERTLHIDALILRPKWRPSWIWELIDDLLPAINQSWDGDPTSPSPAVAAFRALEFTKLGPAIGHTFAAVNLVDQALNLLLPHPIVSRRFRTYGLRWFGVSVYAAKRIPNGDLK